ncbi:putative RNA-directed DNA polymerase [Helianthus debilis subsp. tardiflorus]
MTEILGLTTAAQIWMALARAYRPNSIERVHTLKDSLRQLQKGNSSVAEYGKKFKSLLNDLAAIGHPVDEHDKSHWFLCGLGPSYEIFSTSRRGITPPPLFRDLLDQAQNQELFLASLNASQPAQAAFVSQKGQGPRQNSSSRGGRGSYRGGSNGKDRVKRSPHCQLCRKQGHYASSCPNLASYANNGPPIDANLAQAFHAQCHVTTDQPDWKADTGATAHMVSPDASLNSSSPYSGQDN